MLDTIDVCIRALTRVKLLRFTSEKRLLLIIYKL